MKNPGPRGPGFSCHFRSDRRLLVLVSIEGGVLADADAAARKLGITRSELITRGLRAVMVAVA